MDPEPSQRPTAKDWPALEALTVDLWYTLIYPTPGTRAAIETGRRAVWSEALREGGCTPRRAERWARQVERAADEAELNGLSPSWEDRVARWSRRIGVPLDPAAMADRFVESVPLEQVRAAPGALAVLDRLRRRGVRLAMVSNASHEPPRAVHNLLRAHGIEERFDAVVLSSEVGRAKPRREPFRRALIRIGAAPGGTVHVGDAEADFRGALAAGIRPLLYTGLRRWKPDRLRVARPPWLRSALSVRQWEDVPRVCHFFGTLPAVPQMAPVVA